MSKLLRYLLTGAAIVIIAIWVFMVLRSWQEGKTTDKTINQSPTELSDSSYTETDDPGDIDYADAVKSGKEDAETGLDDEENDQSLSEMENTSGRRLTDATAGSDDSPYLVIAGTYTSDGNAEAEARRLQKLGYTNAEVVQFIGSRYYTVCVDRVDQLSVARQLRNKVKADNTEEVYVHRRRGVKR